MPQVVRFRVANPRRKKSNRSQAKKSFRARRRTTRRRTRRNPLMGGGELALMTNPKRKRRNRARRRSNPFFSSKKRSVRRRRRSNPFGFSRRRRMNRRRNPVIAGYGTVDLLKVGISAAAGAYGTRALTQLVLQSNNTGWMGYGANILAALGLGYAADKFLGKDYGIGVIAGGLAGVATRIWQDKVSQTSPSQLSGMGDLDFSASGMGDYVNSPFPVPTVSVKNTQGQYIAQNPWPQALPAATAAASTKSSSGMGRVPVARFRNR